MKNVMSPVPVPVKKEKKFHSREVAWRRLDSGQVLISGFNRVVIIDPEVVDKINPEGGDVMCHAIKFKAKSGRQGIRIKDGNTHVLSYQENMERIQFLRIELKRALYQEFTFTGPHIGAMIQVISSGETPELKINDIRES